MTGRTVGIAIGSLSILAGAWVGYEIMSVEGEFRRIAPIAIACFALVVVAIVGRYQGR